MTTNKTEQNVAASEMGTGSETPLDSKYRLIVVAARRSKQLQRGARPRVDMDAAKHKTTRIAMSEVMSGKIAYTVLEDV